MKPFTKTLVGALLLLFVAACSGEPADEATTSHEHTTGVDASAAATTPQMIDGVQVVEIEAGPMGFVPGKIALEAGIPARLVFTRTVEGACSEQVRLPDFGIEATDLPLGEPVAIELTPEDGGAFTFVCGMDMQEGTLMVEG